MFAILRTGGKQYRVSPGNVLKIEKLEGDVGSAVSLPEVLIAGQKDQITLGSPTIEGASVEAEIIDQGRSRKIIVFKKRRRQNSRRKNGHRQSFSVIRVREIRGV